MGRYWAIAFSAMAGIVIPGCGGNAASDPSELDILKMLDASKTGHDPVNFEEVALGEFFVTRENRDHLPLMVRFEAYAVVHTKRKQEFETLLEKHKHTLRDAIRAQIQETDTDYLNDAKLDWLRNQLRPLINRILQTQNCKDVVFPRWELEEPIKSL